MPGYNPTKDPMDLGDAINLIDYVERGADNTFDASKVGYLVDMEASIAATEAEGHYTGNQLKALLDGTANNSQTQAVLETPPWQEVWNLYIKLRNPTMASSVMVRYPTPFATQIRVYYSVGSGSPPSSWTKLPLQITEPKARRYYLDDNSEFSALWLRIAIGGPPEHER